MLLVIALFLFLCAAVALVVATARIWVTLAQDAGADIAVGLLITAFLAFVLSGYAIATAADRKRRSEQRTSVDV